MVRDEMELSNGVECETNVKHGSTELRNAGKIVFYVTSSCLSLGLLLYSFVSQPALPDVGQRKREECEDEW
ncbi:hypothetical protein E2C01_042229 [Portunus trituberculatus]|uniref:Uncharacterized protein n=1 Tax=Portunus trituberculatus TaxID=210409 RepID=A0A5B7FSI2_PORTR|nr:hypothetical protein [Portunus trituberculatus]